MPGAPFLILAAPSLFGFYFSMVLIPLLEAIGTTCAYFLSKEILSGFIIRWKPKMVHNFCKRVESSGSNIFFYVVFMRINPFFLKPLINICAPIAQIPVKHFFLGTFIGYVP